MAWGVLLGAAAVAAYILAGYPLLLAALPWRRRPSVRKDPAFTPTVTAVLAVYNGAQYIRGKLESILGMDYPRERLQVLVVSDGATDETVSIAREFAAQNVRVIERPHEGKAAALNAAAQEAEGDILFFTDVRQPLDPHALRHLAANFADASVGAVTGELRFRDTGSGEQADMGLYWRYELWARSRHGEIDSLFNTTGCLYAMRRSLFSPLPEDTLSDDAVLPLRAFFAGNRVIFDPNAVAYDYANVAGGEFRRRWRNLAGLWQVHARMPALFSGLNRMRFHFLSHKFGRLVLPWALLTVAVATVALEDSLVRTTLLVGEAAIVVVALLDRWMPAGPLKRLSSLARTFLLMNLAALAAVLVFFIPPRSLWKPTRIAGR